MSEEEKKAIEDLKRLRKGIEILNQVAPEKDDTDIKAIDIILHLIDNQRKEIEEKSTILLAGAEKVKQLEKGNRSLMESRIKWKNRYYKEKAKNKECISKDKIRERIKEARKIRWHIPKLVIEYFEELLEEN